MSMCMVPTATVIDEAQIQAAIEIVTRPKSLDREAGLAFLAAHDPGPFGRAVRSSGLPIAFYARQIDRAAASGLAALKQSRRRRA
jgi:hypothetical protein